MSWRLVGQDQEICGFPLIMELAIAVMAKDRLVRHHQA